MTCPGCGGSKSMTIHPAGGGVRLMIRCPFCSLNDDTLRVLAQTEGWTR